jgi:hypothetical protein
MYLATGVRAGRSGAGPRSGGAVALAAGAAVEDELHVDVVGHHQRLDPPAQAAQAERHDRYSQLGRGADIAALLVERDVHDEPIVMAPREPSCVGLTRPAFPCRSARRRAAGCRGFCGQLTDLNRSGHVGPALDCRGEKPGSPRAAEAERRHYAMRHVLADPQARAS